MRQIRNPNDIRNIHAMREMQKMQKLQSMQSSRGNKQMAAAMEVSPKMRRRQVILLYVVYMLIITMCLLLILLFGMGLLFGLEKYFIWKFGEDMLAEKVVTYEYYLYALIIFLSSVASYASASQTHVLAMKQEFKPLNWWQTSGMYVLGFLVFLWFSFSITRNNHFAYQQMVLIPFILSFVLGTFTAFMSNRKKEKEALAAKAAQKAEKKARKKAKKR